MGVAKSLQAVQQCSHLRVDLLEVGIDCGLEECVGMHIQLSSAESTTQVFRQESCECRARLRHRE